MTQAQTRPNFPYGPDGKPWSELLTSAGLVDHPDLVTDPRLNPVEVYQNGDGPDPAQFQLPATGLTDKQRRRALDTLDDYLETKRDHFLGYQVNCALDYRTDLARFMDHPINNVGDPYTSGGLKVNSKAVEQAVLDYFAALWRAEWPHRPDEANSYWGYMLSMGSTEGNMYALWNARDYLGGKALIADPSHSTTVNSKNEVVPNLVYVQAKTPERSPNYYKPIAFFSEDTHYSFTKAVRVLAVDTFSAAGQRDYPGECPITPDGAWPAEVPSHDSGAIDVAKLVVLVEFFAERGHPIMVSLNYGSTFKGAYDNVQLVCEKLYPVFERYGLLERDVEYAPGQHSRRHGFWIHVDGALGAAYMPFLRIAANSPEYQYVPEVPIPEFDFSLAVQGMKMVASIAMSGHKWIGAPWPCGIYMTKVKYQLQPPDSPVYIGSLDTTFAGSRNGFSPLILWDFLAKHSYDAQISLAREAQDLAVYLEDQLQKLASHLGRDLLVARTPLALTVRFRKPNDRIIARYSLSTESLLLEPGNPASRQDYAHVFTMIGTEREVIDRLIKDLHAPDAFPETEPILGAPPAAAEPPSGIVPIAYQPADQGGFA
ncbi:pyridoxal-dependent decarboxylase [Nocardia terpenica]|uniref:Histidine decarboxylase n=1 Tax=Nocardia terpenica TaxID=455432 RepID=A0A291RM93_9NOCA|nr:pyridoxal-dependent decarboxylase [Nocardia terpenica]ATL68693.1 histidine decarboxylase [Nocardia terpenica]